MKRDLGNAVVALGPTLAVASGDGRNPPAGKPRLLIVDDEKQVLDGLALHLRRGFEVVARTSGRSALEELDSGEPFSAVISDLRMPQMDGLEVLAEIRRRAPETTRVLLTGHADVGSAIAAVNEAGVHRFLTKPCPPAQLARALDAAIASAVAARGEKVDEKLALLGRQATLGTMAGSIGHEIANLVAALSGSVEVVQSRVQRGTVPTAEDIGLIGVVTNRLQGHTRALLDLARPRDRKIENLDVGVVVCATLDLLNKTGITKVVKTQVSLPQTALYIDADQSLVEGMIVNLVKNAAEAHAEAAQMAWRSRRPRVVESPLITVSIERRGDDAVAIVVEDNGPGIPADVVGRLFKPYFTTKGSSGGMGLGLAIVRESVRQHGGTIEVSSALTVGTRFTIELPLSGSPASILLDEQHDGRGYDDGGVDEHGGSIIRLTPRT